MLLVVSCASKKNESEVIYEVEEIDFPEFPYFENAKMEEDGSVSFSWRGESGNVPAEWFYALAEYINGISSIELYLDKVRKIGN